MKKLFCEKCGQVWFISNKHSDTICDFCGSLLTEKGSTKGFNDISEECGVIGITNSSEQLYEDNASVNIGQ